MGRKYTEAQKRAAENYLSGFSQFVVRMRPDDLERLDRAAEAAGKSRAAFVQDAVMDAIDKQNGAGGQHDSSRNERVAEGIRVGVEDN